MLFFPPGIISESSTKSNSDGAAFLPLDLGALEAAGSALGACLRLDEEEAAGVGAFLLDAGRLDITTAVSLCWVWLVLLPIYSATERRNEHDLPFSAIEQKREITQQGDFPNFE